MSNFNSLEYPLCYFEADFETLRERAGREGDRTLKLGLGWHRMSEGDRWLVRRAQDARSEGRLLKVCLTNNPPPTEDVYLRREEDPAVAGHLYVGNRDWEDCISGFIQTPEGIRPLDLMNLIGPKMSRVPMLSSRRSNFGLSDEQNALEELLRSDEARERSSRTIGAIGEESWRELCRLRYAIIGAGRSGEACASALATLGARHLTMIDSDLLEPGNLGEMVLASDEDIGRPKAEIIAKKLWTRSSWMRCNPVVASINSPQARQAAAEADVIICCVDRDSARLGGAMLAAEYHRLLIDIGVGIFPASDVKGDETEQETARAVRMGADVRLVLPGDCLLCCGGLRDRAGAILGICNPQWEEEQHGDWRRERAGSLRPLNEQAVSTAMFMLIGVVRGTIGKSSWRRIEIDPDGHQRLSEPAWAADPNCELCALAGRGDEII